MKGALAAFLIGFAALGPPHAQAAGGPEEVLPPDTEQLDGLEDEMARLTQEIKGMMQEFALMQSSYPQKGSDPSFSAERRRFIERYRQRAEALSTTLRRYFTVRERNDIVVFVTAGRAMKRQHEARGREVPAFRMEESMRELARVQSRQDVGEDVRAFRSQAWKAAESDENLYQEALAASLRKRQRRLIVSSILGAFGLIAAVTLIAFRRRRSARNVILSLLFTPLFSPAAGAASRPEDKPKPSSTLQLLGSLRDDISGRMGEIDPLLSKLAGMRDSTLEHGEPSASLEERQRLRSDILARKQALWDKMQLFHLTRKQDDMKRIVSMVVGAVGNAKAFGPLSSGITQYHSWGTFDKEARSFIERIDRTLNDEDEAFQAVESARRIRRRWARAAGAALVLLLAALAALGFRLRRRDAPAATQRGAILKGAYRIVRLMDAPPGSPWAEVCSAVDLGLDRKVVLKRLRAELAEDRGRLERFLSQARRAAALKHPNIVGIYSVFEEGRAAFLVFEAVEGVPLSRRLEINGSLSLNTVKDILRQAAAAVDYAHSRNVLHRCLKPSSLLLGAGDLVKVADFGATTPSADAYQAPEQQDGETALRESDIYSLGAVVCTMLTGRPPSGVSAGLSPSVERVLHRALRSDPLKRYHSAAAFAAALDEAHA
jgi:hypothetical protein